MEVIRKNQNTKAIINGKAYYLPTLELDNLKSNLNISFEEAIELWLSDHDIIVNEEQEELDEKASKVKINRDIVQNKSKKERKKPEIKISDQKKQLFNEILAHLQSIYGENVAILNENKLISVKIDNISFKIDVIQQRKA